MPAPRCARRWTPARRHQVPTELLDVVLAIVRDRPVSPVARISTTRAGPAAVRRRRRGARRVLRRPGHRGSGRRRRHGRAAVARVGTRTRRATRRERRADGPAVQPAARRRCRTGRPRLQAGAGARHVAEGPSRPTRCIGRWPSRSTSCWCGTARCAAEADDAVHQMRVTTRKIRSLLQASPDSFGLADDARILDELRELGNVLGVARDAEVLADRYRSALDELPPELVRGPIRERLVERRRAALPSRAAACVDRDALTAILPSARRPGRGGRPKPPPAEPASRRRRPSTPPTRRSARRPRPRDGTLADGARPRRGAAPNPQARQATSLHRGGDRREQGVQAGQEIQSLLGDHQDSVVSREHLSAAGRGRARRRRGHLHLRVALSAGSRPGGGQPPAARPSAAQAGQSGAQAVAADSAGRASWPVSRILFRVTR